MKKLLLVVLMVFSLDASQAVCDDSYARYLKYGQSFTYALDRDDVVQMKVSNAMRIKYIEKSLVECGTGWEFRKNALNIRKDLIRISKILKTI